MGQRVGSRGLAAILAASLATGCSLLLGENLAGGGEESAPDAAIETSSGEDAAPSDAGTVPDASIESGIFVRGFSKTPRVTTRSLTLVRPAATQVGDVILIAVRWLGTMFFGTFKPLLETRGCLPAPDGGSPSLAGYLYFGYRIAAADDPTSWSIGSSNDSPAEAIVVALGGTPGVPLDDSRGQVNPAGTADAPSVMVQSIASRLLVGFSSPGPVAWPTPEGLEPVTSTESLAIFTKVQPKGATPTFSMPSGLTTTCSIAATLALPPK